MPSEPTATDPGEAPGPRRPPVLAREGDRLVATFFTGEGEEEPREVRLVRARPLSDPDRDIAVVDPESHEELLMLPSLEVLDGPSREIAGDELYRAYCLAVVEEVREGKVQNGQRFLRVATDRGERYFNLKEPGRNVSWLSADRVVIRDSMGNRFLVPSVAALDRESRARLDRVL